MAKPTQNNEHEKKATLWEKTIVTAFRDLQWEYKGEKCVRPATNIGLAGNSERALGDGIVSAGERLYLLEMKSEGSGKATEWKLGDEKRAYASLKKILNKSNNSSEIRNKIQEYLLNSMRAHLFLYWTPSPDATNTRIKPGSLTISSYLLDISLLSPVSNLEISKIISSKNSIAFKCEDENGSKFNPKLQIAARRIFDGTGRLLSDRAEDGVIAFKLGLTPQELYTYTKVLVDLQDEKDLPINAIVASENGALCQHISHMDDLLELLHGLISNPVIKADVDLDAIEVAHPTFDATSVSDEPTPRSESTFKP